MRNNTNEAIPKAAPATNLKITLSIVTVAMLGQP